MKNFLQLMKILIFKKSKIFKLKFKFFKIKCDQKFIKFKESNFMLKGY